MIYNGPLYKVNLVPYMEQNMPPEQLVQVNVPHGGSEKAKVDFTNLKNAVKNAPVEKPQMFDTSNINIGATSGADPAAYYRLFENINDMSDQAIYELVWQTYRNVLSYAFSNNKDEVGVLWSLFNNVRYVTALDAVLSSNPISEQEMRACNNIIYNYITCSNGDKNEAALKPLMNLAMTVNDNGVISEMVSAGIPMDTAAKIMACNYSAPMMNARLGVRRVNLFLVNENKPFTDSQIFRIYECLYAGCLTVLVEGTMLNPLQTTDLTDDQQDVYFLEANCMLDLLEQAPVNVIGTVLANYTADYINFANGNKRFDMDTISKENWPRITATIENLKFENVYVP